MPITVQVIDVNT